MSRTVRSAHALRDATTRPWSGAAGRAALLVLLVQVLWRGWYVVHGFFTQDDFVIIAMARRRPLGQLLFSDYYGHLLPARWVLADLVAHGGQLPWGLAATLILVLMAATSALMWVVLTRLLPGRWARLPILALFCFSPLTLWTAQQWIVAMQFYPVTICLLGSVWGIIRLVEEDWWPGQWLPAVLTAAALLFQERALLFPIAYGGIALVLVGGSFGGRIGRALRRLWTTWASLVAVVVGYFLLHAVAAPIVTTPLVDQSGDLLSLIGNLVFRNALPGLVGGPWHPAFFGDAALVPPSWSVLLAVAALAALVVVTSVRGGPATWWAWILVGGYLAADIGILFGGKSAFGSQIGLIPRYTADLAPVFALSLACALRDVGPIRLRGRLGRLSARTVALATTVVVALSALPTTLIVAPVLENRDDRGYAEGLARQLERAPDTVVLDTAPPDTILVPWFGNRTRVSTVLSTLRTQPRFDLPSESLRVPDDRGVLRPVRVRGSVHMRPTGQPQCGYAVSSRLVRIPLERALPAMRRVARIDYYSGGDSVLTVDFGGSERHRVSFVADAGLHSIYAPVDGAFDALTVHNDDPAVTVCIAQVAVGAGVPATP